MITNFELEQLIEEVEAIEKHVASIKDTLKQRLRYAKGKRDKNPIIIPLSIDEHEKFFGDTPFATSLKSPI